MLFSATGSNPKENLQIISFYDTYLAKNQSSSQSSLYLSFQKPGEMEEYYDSLYFRWETEVQKDSVGLVLGSHRKPMAEQEIELR